MGQESAKVSHGVHDSEMILYYEWLWIYINELKRKIGNTSHLLMEFVMDRDMRHSVLTVKKEII